MAFITPDDLKTHLYPEVVSEITREDDTIAERAIKTAVSEAKSYLSRFDLTWLFTDTSEVTDHLRNIVKDIAAWHLVRLANPDVNLELFRTVYEDAKKSLEMIRDGKADPEGWPYKPDDANTDYVESSGVQWGSNKKNTQHF